MTHLKRPRGRAAGTALLLGLATSCTDAGPTDGGVQRVDSAGIEIVTNGSTEVPLWRLGAEPEFSIGVLEGESAFEFGFVVDGRSLPDGGVVLTDAQSREVRNFGPGATIAGHPAEMATDLVSSGPRST